MSKFNFKRVLIQEVRKIQGMAEIQKSCAMDHYCSPRDNLWCGLHNISAILKLMMNYYIKKHLYLHKKNLKQINKNLILLIKSQIFHRSPRTMLLVHYWKYWTYFYENIHTKMLLYNSRMIFLNTFFLMDFQNF